MDQATPYGKRAGQGDGAAMEDHGLADKGEVLAYILSMVTELSQMASRIDEPELARRLMHAVAALLV